MIFLHNINPLNEGYFLVDNNIIPLVKFHINPDIFILDPTYTITNLQFQKRLFSPKGCGIVFSVEMMASHYKHITSPGNSELMANCFDWPWGKLMVTWNHGKENPV